MAAEFCLRSVIVAGRTGYWFDGIAASARCAPPFGAGPRLTSTQQSPGRVPAGSMMSTFVDSGGRGERLVLLHAVGGGGFKLHGGRVHGLPLGRSVVEFPWLSRSGRVAFENTILGEPST